MYKKLTLALGLAFTQTWAAAAAGAGNAHPPARPNILMILADDLGYSDIGAFGSEIHTPNLDALAKTGRLLTNYHTAATCSPTRAMFLSGVDHHQAGLGQMAETVRNMVANRLGPFGRGNTYPAERLPPGYEGYLNDRVVTLPQLLRDAGYHTYMAGKWHLAYRLTDGENGLRMGFRPESFPNKKGFEHSFALLPGGASHFAPVPGKLTPEDKPSGYVEDDKPVQIPADFYSSNFFTDKLISYIDANKADGKPFFTYAAYTAPHFPLHAPDADIARYKGKYDEGYEAVRARRIARLKELGIVKAGFQSNPGLDAETGHARWSELTPAQRAAEAREMEVYAAMVENMDRNIGRLIQHLKDIGAYDNTLIVFTSDNGAEGRIGHELVNENVDNSIENIGRPLSSIGYGERWAEVCETPFRLWKGYATEGGVSVPMIVRMPHQETARPASAMLAHVTDLLPTFLEAARVARPGASYNGAPVIPPSGVSLLAQLTADGAPSTQAGRAVLADELFGNRYVISGQWKLVSVNKPFGNGEWALYDLNNDRGEIHDVSSRYPEVTARLAKDYEAYAKRVGLVFTPFVIPRPADPGKM